MRHELIIKQGPQELARVQGRDVNLLNITLADIQKTIEVEQWLERMFGLRFHIQSDMRESIK